MGNNGDGKFLTGFILGIIIGGGIIFLFGTKKGKKLLKTITEEGVESFSDLIERVEEGEYSQPGFNREERTAEESGFQIKEKEEIKKPPVHRFFKGTPRRSN